MAIRTEDYELSSAASHFTNTQNGANDSSIAGTLTDIQKECNDPSTAALSSSYLSRIGLFLVAASYSAVGFAGLYFSIKRGHSWHGTTDTLTSVLAVAGVIFNGLVTLLGSLCKSAALNYMGNKAIEKSVTLERLNQMDIATRGSVFAIFTLLNPFSWLFQVLLPALGIATSAIFKKALGTSLGTTTQLITGLSSSFYDPTNISSAIRGTAWAGAIFYNISTNFNNGGGLERSSIYLLANASDSTGLQCLNYTMPAVPELVISGNAGYTQYIASDVPSLGAQVQCFDNSSALPISGSCGDDGTGCINNGDTSFEIYIFPSPSGTAYMQVTSSTTGLSWACSSQLFDISPTIIFGSDRSGNWNVTTVDASDSLLRTTIDFSTTSVRLDMMADLISDGLGSAAAAAAWDWSVSRLDSPGYEVMLESSRLSFGAATLSFSDTRPSIPAAQPTGIAQLSVEEVVLFSNWALYATIALVFIQALIGFAHWRMYGKLTVDFGILQIMEMQNTATASYMSGSGINARRLDDVADTDTMACELEGNCTGRRSKLPRNGKVAIRVAPSAPGSRQHLMLSRFDDQTLGKVHEGGKYT